MKKTVRMHIASCGMNCSLCLAFQREKNTCPGCRGPDKDKPKYCAQCILKNCIDLKRAKASFCYACEKPPCKRLKQLDKRYRTKYGMSMVENLKTIDELGLEAFIDAQTKKWTCKGCGALLCVHRGVCQNCGKRNPRFPGVLKG